MTNTRTNAIRNTAAKLAKIQNRKTKAAFAARIDREAAGLGCTADELLDAVRGVAAERNERRNREAAGWKARQAEETALMEAWAAARADLLAAGWALTHESESGSEYYQRDGRTLRLADHLVPATPERDMAAADRGNAGPWDVEIIVGSMAWRSHVAQLCE